MISSIGILKIPILKVEVGLEFQAEENHGIQDEVPWMRAKLACKQICLLYYC
jgi:hypothetical protein